MKPFDELLREDITEYEGRHDQLIFQAPSFYRLLVNLLDDPALPGRLRPLVIAGIAYFILPADIVPEDIHGPYGYVDDIFLCAIVADRIRKELGPAILDENWDGETPVQPLIDELLAGETALVGDNRERILKYVGFEHLVPGQPL